MLMNFTRQKYGCNYAFIKRENKQGNHFTPEKDMSSSGIRQQHKQQKLPYNEIFHCIRQFCFLLKSKTNCHNASYESGINERAAK